jgi:GH24 family phage-related lysozyme (muramidase)
MFNIIEYLPKLREFEGAIPYMYLDTAGNVTVGVGNLVASANAAEQLGFVRRGILSASPPVIAVPATATEIQTDYENVYNQTAGNVAGYYKQFTRLDLPDDVINSLLNSRVAEFQARLIAAFPDFQTYPDQACAGLVDMGFNLGVAGLTSKFPTFCKAVRNRDWVTAAKQCHRAPPVNDDRNDWTKAQFDQASADETAPTAPSD